MLFMALFVHGAMAGANDVAMNSHAVGIEKLFGKPTMSRFHAMFSLGGIAGAGMGALVASQGIAPTMHFAVAVVLILGLIVAAAPVMLDTHERHEKRARMQFTRPPRALIVLSAIGFCIFLSEGAIADWTAVYIRQVLHGGEGVAGLGYAVFSATMTIFRFCGDCNHGETGPSVDYSCRWPNCGLWAGDSCHCRYANLGAGGLCGSRGRIFVNHPGGVRSRRTRAFGKRSSGSSNSERDRVSGLPRRAANDWIYLRVDIAAGRPCDAGCFKRDGSNSDERGKRRRTTGITFPQATSRRRVRLVCRMSFQIFLHGRILGTEQFLRSAVNDLEGRAQWVSSLSEAPPRELLTELGLSPMLLGQSGGDQFLLLIPAEFRAQAEDFCARASADALEKSGGAVRLVWAITENLGDWSDIRRRLQDDLQRKTGTPAAVAGAKSFDTGSLPTAEDFSKFTPDRWNPVGAARSVERPGYSSRRNSHAGLAG